MRVMKGAHSRNATKARRAECHNAFYFLYDTPLLSISSVITTLLLSSSPDPRHRNLRTKWAAVKLNHIVYDKRRLLPRGG